MKNILKNTVSISMVLLLIVSTLQFSIYKMECLITGNAEISLSDFDDCNAKENTDCTISGSCCCFHQLDLDLNYNAKINFSDLIIFQNALTLPKAINTSPSFSFTKKEISFFSNLPPPSGVELLKAIQLFLI